MPETELLEVPTPAETPAPKAPGAPRKRASRAKAASPFARKRGRPFSNPPPLPVVGSENDEDSYYPDAVYVQVEPKVRSYDMVSPIGQTLSNEVSVPGANGIWLTLKRPRRSQLNGIIDDEIQCLKCCFPFRSDDTEFVTVHNFPKKEVVKAIYRAQQSGAPLVITPISDEQLAQERTEKNRVRMTGAYIDPTIGYQANIKHPSGMPGTTNTVGRAMPSRYVAS